MTAPEASYHEVVAKTLLRRSGVADPWFLGRFGMNLYRGCEHGCRYCDGRAERYYVTGVFDRDIQVKRNAGELLARALERRREPGFVFIGGGVSDAYQPAEARYSLARRALELCLDHGLPVHLLTKSALVERDLDLLGTINAKSRAILSFSIASTDEHHRELFEPRAAPFSERWRILAAAHERGLGTGVMAMPLLPGLSDQPEAIAALVGRATAAGADFVCLGGLTLRPGVQKEGFIAALAADRPDLIDGYRRLYAQERPSGMADPRYYARLDARARAALDKYGMPGRAPWRLFKGLLPTYAETAILVEHDGFAMGEPSGRGPFAQTGFALQEWARNRLSKSRHKDAYRIVENDFATLVRSHELGRALGFAPAIVATIEGIFEQVMAARGG